MGVVRFLVLTKIVTKTMLPFSIWYRKTKPLAERQGVLKKIKKIY
ncbi:hypothetical protein FCR2A7T_24640 [Flavobacterium cauense R2A-7]|nr:hypothetical protein FCR2A7T_24640 [Flavobacterium cauense R2A-7]